MPAANTPAAEVPIDEGLVRSLLEDQAPEHAALPISFLAEGWDNALYRVGDHLVARLPRRQLGADLVQHELTWLPQLAGGLPLPIPVPMVRGMPTADYPWRWSLCPWLDGRPASVEPLDDEVAAATVLGGFVAAFHRPAPADAPLNPHRGQPLAARHERTSATIRDLSASIDVSAVAAAWKVALTTPAWDEPPSWIHGDLHPGNVLVDDGAFSAVIDFGDICAGDPATDLAVAWMLFGDDGRAAFRRAAGVDDATWARGRGWAISLGLAVLGSSADNAAYTAFAHRAIDAAVGESYSR